MSNMATNPFADIMTSTTDGGDGSIGTTSRPLTPLPSDTRFGGAPELVQRHSSALPPSVMFGTPRDSVGSVEGGPLAAEGAAPAGIGAGAGDMSAKEMTEGAGGVGIGDAATVDAARRRRRRRWTLFGIAVFFVVAAAVAVPVGVIFGRKDSGSGSGGSAGGGGGAADGKNGATSGGDGSLVTTEDGSTFTYSNPFGGIWVDDPNDPFTGSAYPNSFTPPLNTSWTWGVDRLYGVNLGGWFVLEPFIAPALFEKYQNATAIAANNGLPIVVDEWTLSQAMAADTSAGGGLSQLEAHYNTFITEEDIAQIAGAGLNWLRVPIPYWAVDVWDTPSNEEPFLTRTCWTYILRLFRWARKYGLRINLDLHTAPGSQNGYNHSGKEGQINFLNDVMGYANAQRMLGYIRSVAEFISQPEYEQLIPMFGIINEPLIGIIGQDVITHFYLQAYDMIREITGIGEGHGPYIGIHDGFAALSSWANFLPGSDRINLDTHPYFAFGGFPLTDPIGVWPARACDGWAGGINVSQVQFGVTIAGEFSTAMNDCGLYVDGIADNASITGDCAFWTDPTQWNQTIIDGLMQYTLASMDALQNWFYWTWKVGNSSATGTVQSPLWSYQLGLEGGWIPRDPRTAVGACAALDTPSQPFNGSYASWQTGGAGAGTIDPTVLSSFQAWPPASMSGVTGGPVSLIYAYTSTAAPVTLPSDTVVVSDLGKKPTVTVGDGWADPSDTASFVTEVAECSYPSAWFANGSPVPATPCGGTGGAAGVATATDGAAATPAAARMAREMRITQPPRP